MIDKPFPQFIQLLRDRKNGVCVFCVTWKEVIKILRLEGIFCTLEFLVSNLFSPKGDYVVFGQEEVRRKWKITLTGCSKLYAAMQTGDARFIFHSTCIILNIQTIQRISYKWPQHHELPEISEKFALPYTIDRW